MVQGNFRWNLMIAGGVMEAQGELTARPSCALTFFPGMERRSSQELGSVFTGRTGRVPR